MTLPRLVSPDDHLITPPHTWQDRLPSKLVDRGPRIVRVRGTITGPQSIEFTESPEGRLTDVWSYDGRLWAEPDLATRPDVPVNEKSRGVSSFDEMPKSCWDPIARLEAMDLANIEASVCYPNMWVRFCGQTFSLTDDKELALACIRAYNDFVVDEWCASSGGRLIPMMIVPLWDVKLAVAEVERNAARGVRAVTFSEAPHLLGLPSLYSRYWDPFYAACEAAGVVVNLHIGTGGFPSIAKEAGGAAFGSMFSMASAGALVDLIFSGVLDRFPRTRVVLAESQVGWAPYILHRADQVYIKQQSFGAMDGMSMKPSEYFQRNVWLTFFDDPIGIELIDRVGADKVLYEVDFPHNDSEWPRSYDYLKDVTAGLDDNTAALIAAGNARRLFVDQP